MVKTLERDRYTLCEKHVIVPFCCSYQVYRYLAGCFGLISCRHYLEWTQNIIDNADFALKQRRGTQYAFYTSGGFAVLDNNGEIGTAGQLDERGKLLYDEVMKHVRAK